MLSVSEIFYSIQGESSFAGMPCVFVRLAGCNLRCSYCDTAYAYGGGTERSLEWIRETVQRYPAGLVEITGGEPLLQPETPALAKKLVEEGRTILVETNGSCDIDLLPPPVIRIVDIKCPGSGAENRNDWNNIPKLRPADEVKFVIRDRADFEWAMGILDRHQLSGRVMILFSPVRGDLSPTMLAEWILRERLPVRLQLQLHKILWPMDERGR